jgi:PKD repeat protein
MGGIISMNSFSRSVIIGSIISIMIGAGIAAAAPFPDYNNIYVNVANDQGVKYNAFGNNTYFVQFAFPGSGQNAVHISNTNSGFGQVTETSAMNGTFWVTDTGGKGYEDDVILMFAVNGTIPDNFRLHVRASGSNWTPIYASPGVNAVVPDISVVNYVDGSINETFGKSDFIYGPTLWRPCSDPGCPIFYGQNMGDTGNTFQVMYIDTRVGLLSKVPGVTDNGMVKVEYSIENLHSRGVFDAYAWCHASNNGYDMMGWTSRTFESGSYSGWSVFGTTLAVPVPIPGQANPPTDPDHDGLYEDLSGNGATTYTDVLLFFKNLEWIQVNEPVSAFDFSGNGAVTYTDIRLLFNEVP